MCILTSPLKGESDAPLHTDSVAIYHDTPPTTD
jgi:hypothetical protein